ncbi:MAG: hypothetical protein SFT94_02165 [Pseudanabaenaceae cyanobacterium bins.68]|nr:hypothetical protein [Pseudanabaenaceae cyanobacterium bins.68]
MSSKPLVDLSQIVGVTKPLTRVDGFALVAGDRFYRTSDGIEFYWTGTVWASTQLFTHTFGTVSTSGGGYTQSNLEIPNDFNCLITGFRIQGRIDGSTNNASDYWTFSPKLAAGFAFPGLSVISTQGITYAQFDNIWLKQNYSYLIALDVGATLNATDWGTRPIGIGCEWSTVGTPSSIGFQQITTYRLAI